MEHISFSKRVKLQVSIENKSACNLKDLGDLLGKDSSSIYKEIKMNSLKKRGKGIAFNNGTKNFQYCRKLHKFPYCCNNCPFVVSCSKDKVIYDAYEAENKSEEKLHNSRKNINKKMERVKRVEDVISLRVKNGQSPEIANFENSFNVSNSTIRRYINDGLLTCKNIDLHRKPRLKCKKEYDYHRNKSIDVKVLFNRMYKDYEIYMKSNPDARVIQIDTVYGSKNDKKFLLTIYWINSSFQIGILISRSAIEVNKTISALYKLGLKNNTILFDTILTDNGVEFSLLKDIEADSNGEIRFRTFYCDPYRAGQKGACERNHEFIRFFKNKGEQIDNCSQEFFNNMFSQINSYPRRKLGYAKPYNLFQKDFPNFDETLIGITEIGTTNIKLK